LGAVLDALEGSIQRTGGQLVQTLMLDGRELALTVEAPDDLSWFRIVREAESIGIQLRARPALTRVEAEALDRAHRLRSMDDG
jgi:hypothetical protein